MRRLLLAVPALLVAAALVLWPAAPEPWAPPLPGPGAAGPDQEPDSSPGRRDTEVPRRTVESLRPGRPIPIALPDGPVRVHGQVRRAGQPLPRYDLVFQPAGGGLDGAEEDWDFTGDEGRYEVRLRPGRYLVVHDDDGSWISGLDIVEGETDRLLDIDLPFGHVHGRVLDGETGQPVSGATVYAHRTWTPASDAATEGLMARAGDAHTGADGSYDLVDLPPGDYAVAATHDGIRTPPAEVILGDGGVQELDLVLKAGHTLTGVLRGPGGGTLAMDVRVIPGPLTSLSQFLIGEEHFTGDDGELVVESLQPGLHTIFAVGELGFRYVALQAAVEFQPGQPPVQLTAQECGSLSVTIAHADGTPVPEAYLDMRTRDGAPVLASLEWLEDAPTSDPDGRIELDDVVPGSYRIAPGVRGILGSPVYVEVLPGETTELLLTSNGADSPG